MLDLRFVVENLDEVQSALARRSEKDAGLLAPVAEMATERRRIIASTEAKAAERNTASKAMTEKN